MVTMNSWVSWNWWIDPKEPSFDVLEEFKYFSSPESVWWSSDNFASWDVGNWPYSVPYWDWCIQMVKRRIASTEEQRTSRIFEERFERHQYKKSAKLARAQGLLPKGPRIPGAWVD
jgi:hypothetical protein